MGVGSEPMSLKLPPLGPYREQLEPLDRFADVWSPASTQLPPETLSRWKEAATIESVASSCRIAGIRVADTDVTSLLGGHASPTPDASAVLGYAEALECPICESGKVMTSEDLQRFNALVLGEATADPAPKPFRETPLHHEAFDGEGRAVGRVFQTLPPRLIRDKIEDLVAWVEMELRARESHPALTIGAFSMAFVAVSPFEQGNGRMARLLAIHLLRREGYGHLPFASLERTMEDRRTEYHDAYDASTTYLWTGEADISPWLRFWIECLERQRSAVERRIVSEQGVLGLPPLQRKILETVRMHGTAAASQIMATTGANRNTLKDNLRRLVERRLLDRVGRKRGTFYRLPEVPARRRDA